MVVPGERESSAALADRAGDLLVADVVGPSTGRDSTMPAGSVGEHDVRGGDGPGDGVGCDDEKEIVERDLWDACNSVGHLEVGVVQRLRASQMIETRRVYVQSVLIRDLAPQVGDGHIALTQQMIELSEYRDNHA